jgi:hypothetical protein
VAREEFMYVPISVEYLLSALFGKLNYHGYVGAVSKSKWQKDLTKVATYLKKSIEFNVHTDTIHRARLLRSCDDLVEKLKKTKTINDINAVTIECLTRLAFLLLGNMPDHWRRRAPYQDRFWRLDGHRSIQYHQTTEQKAYLLIHLVDIKKEFDISIKDYRDLHDAFYRGFKSKAHPFLLWFKHEYPKIYCEVF